MSTTESLAEILTAAARFVRLAGSVTTSDVPHAVTRALAILDDNDGLRVTEFAALDRSSQPAATALLGRLAERGLVERGKDPADSRAVIVTITEAGREQLAAARHAAAVALTPYLHDIDPEDLTHVLAGLNRLVEALGRTR